MDSFYNTSSFIGGTSDGRPTLSGASSWNDIFQKYTSLAHCNLVLVLFNINAGISIELPLLWVGVTSYDDALDYNSFRNGFDGRVTRL